MALGTFVAREWAGRIATRADLVGAKVPAGVASALGAYLELLVRWNRTINLTSIADADHVVDRLVVEPIVAADAIPRHASRLLDVGSGGGSPAIPLRLCRPELALLMVESRTRKAAFLREAIRRLDLEAAWVEAARLEQLVSRRDLLGTFDVVSIRAVRLDHDLLRALEGLMTADGVVLQFTEDERPFVWHNDEAAAPLVVADRRPLVPALRSCLLSLRRRHSDT